MLELTKIRTGLFTGIHALIHSARAPEGNTEKGVVFDLVDEPESTSPVSTTALMTEPKPRAPASNSSPIIVTPQTANTTKAGKRFYGLRMHRTPRDSILMERPDDDASGTLANNAIPLLPSIIGGKRGPHPHFQPEIAIVDTAAASATTCQPPALRLRGSGAPERR